MSFVQSLSPINTNWYHASDIAAVGKTLYVFIYDAVWTENLHTFSPQRRSDALRVSLQSGVLEWNLLYKYIINETILKQMNSFTYKS